MLKPCLAALWFCSLLAAHAQCTLPQVDLGNDTTLCPGLTFVLNAGTYPTYLWDNGATTATRSVTQPGGTYSVTVSGPGTNLIVNGDFELGNTGFTTSYIIGTGGSWGLLSDPGTYAISTSPNLTHTNFNVCTDHTPAPGQNQMVVNGAMVSNTQVWCQTIAVQANTDYQFGTWVTSALTDPAVAQLQFSINGSQLGTIFSPSSQGCTWLQFTQNWNSGITTSAQICIVNQNTTGGGNDFALDDITFRPVCHSYDTITVQFAPPPVDAGPDLVLCANETDTLGPPPTTGATYLWTPSTAVTGTDTLHQLVVGGISPVSAQTVTYTLQLTDSTGCANTDQVTVTYNPEFTAHFAGSDIQVCADDIGQIGMTAQAGYSYQWTPSTGVVGSQTTANIKVGISGNTSLVTQDYIVSVLDANGCPGTDTVHVDFAPLRPAVFTVPDSLCTGETGFATYTGPAETGLAYAWTFPGGIASGTTTAGPITVSWSTPGIKTVTLKTTTALGCDHDSSKQVIVSAVPTANFSLQSDVCLHGTAALVYTGTGSASAQFAWNFDEGTNSGTAHSPVLSWDSIGTYSPSLVVTENGCTSLPFSRNIVVHSLPVSDFIFQNACESSPILFTSTATAPGNEVIQTSAWNFGGPPPNTAVSASATHSYAGTGIYPVTLTVTTATGCTDDTTLSVQVYPTPQANFSWRDNCENLPTQFTDLSTVAGMSASVVTWQWWFGNGLSDSAQHTAHQYQFNGGSNTYPVRLAVKTNHGCVDTLTRFVGINPVPIVAFSATDVCLHDPTVFTDLTLIDQLDGTRGRNHLAIWKWTFGDSLQTTSTAVNPQYAYPQPGTFTASLTVTSDSGCVSSFSDSLRVFPPPPDPVITDDTVCFNVRAHLKAEAPQGISVRWFEAPTTIVPPFQNGQEFRTPPVVYPVTYYVQTATEHGCTSDLLPVTASLWPDAGAALVASTNIVRMPDLVQFAVTSSQPLAAYAWDFGDDLTSDEAAPAHAFAIPGYYTVRAVVADSQGCLSLLETQVEVQRLATITVPSAFSPNNDLENDELYLPSHNITQLHFKIFDRWGHTLFDTEDVHFRWQGLDGHGMPLPEGIYVYLLEATTFDAHFVTQKGSFLLAR